MGNTKIEWCDKVWNPLRGCSRVSEGCRNCYAERIAGRFSGPQQAYEGLAQFKSGPTQSPLPQIVMNAKWTGEVRFIEEHLNDPLHWKKPCRVFVNSMSDLFHEKVQDEWIVKIFSVMAIAGQHTFQILTKRADRMRRFCSTQVYYGSALDNVWLGVSVEDQKTADERIPLLLQTPAAVRWVSYEPALGPVNFTRLFLAEGETDWGYLKKYRNALTPWESGERTSGKDIYSVNRGTMLDWVVLGGESGPGARPMHPQWARTVRDQCQSAGVPFFFKQWGEWGPCGQEVRNSSTDRIKIDGEKWPLSRVGKKAAGRLLDGREWNEFPA